MMIDLDLADELDAERVALERAVVATSNGDTRCTSRPCCRCRTMARPRSLQRALTCDDVPTITANNGK